jgi:hypothetical protein
MKTLKEWKEEGWKFQYENCFGCYALFRPDGVVVWKDYSFLASEKTVIDIIERHQKYKSHI